MQSADELGSLALAFQSMITYIREVLPMGRKSGEEQQNNAVQKTATP
jgi:hypothetical protein